MPSIKPAKKNSKLVESSFQDETRLTIDPGISGSGLCFWSERNWSRLTPPLEAFNLYSRKGTWEDRAQIMGDQLQEIIRDRRIVRAYVEFPKFMGGSARGNAAAVKGDVAKLLFLVGIFHRVFYQEKVPIENVEVNLWKGQLPKEVVKTRILSRLPGLEVSSHCWDSVGIGLFVKGCFNDRR